MFSLRLAGTNVHEHGHDEGASRVMEWWSPTEARKLGNARAWLPYVEIFNDKKSGELKSTPYETSFLIEEVECCLREAAQHFATAKRLKRIHEREGHPQAQALIQRFVDQGDDRLMWAQRFIDQTKSVVSGDAKIRYLRRSDGIPDLEVILENGQTISLSTGQMWDFPADPVPEFKKVAYLKTFFKDLRTVVGDLETDVKDLRAAFPR